jgi:serine/threonine-protein kinase
MATQRQHEDTQTVDKPGANSLPQTSIHGELPGAVSASGVLPRTTGLTVLPEVSNQGDVLTFRRRDELRYRNEHLLGRGGMGEVRLVLDQDIGRRVAVKRLIDEENPLALARFVDEVRTIGNLEHPNIVPIHDVGVDADGSLFFVMKYVEGETLASIIGKLASGDEASHRRFPFEARLDLFAGLLRALQYAHDQGLIHRDVKPENIMVGQFGEVMLMDWGIARRNRSERPGVDPLPIARAAGETLDGTIIGTPRYLSPEQAAGQVAELDGRSDLYSAFVVLYELLTTRSYIESAGGAIQSVVASRERQPPKLTDPAFSNPHQNSVPSELRHFLRRGLAPRKEERFADASHVIQELERIRSGACEVQCPLTFIKANSTRYERFLDGHPALGLLTATIALAACASGLFAWAMWLFQLVG